ncbi:hypothetical protein [Haloarcula argentinensis]|uniref:Uncharacterized protein n=1 Tax=Haloarcula argentinensis TaxID=43776 RepID=A0A830FW80_HALAR|nr:hypothetical protein [Haloarcula argentinensis]GGM46229.1 hypothetical protein GCM10009006_29370 [Haloarcula argentinensis]
MTGGSQLHEEDGSDKITFRLSTQLKEQYKEQVDNMSADLEEYVRQRVSEPETDGGLEPYDDPNSRELAIAYRTLCKKRTDNGIVRGESAKRALAQAVDSIDQQDAQRLLSRLENRGYVHLQNGIPPSDYTAVHVRPFSRKDGTQKQTADA